MNKCVMNYLGLTLNNFYINGPTKTSDHTNLETSATNTCRGKLGYGNGPEYVFTIDRNGPDCKIEAGADGGEATFKNGVHGQLEYTKNGFARTKNFFLEFGCKFQPDLTQAVRLGEAGSQSTLDQGNSFLCFQF